MTAALSPVGSRTCMSRRILSPPVLAGIVRQAMIDEVDLTPKPGLVDRRNSGAHQDMDYTLFRDSIDLLFPWFEKIAESTPMTGPSEAVVPALRPLGMEAEKAMLAGTGGINTHKGQIFILGIALAATVRLSGDGNPLTAEGILDQAAEICSGLTGELESGGGDETHGRLIFRRYGVAGIRGEAERGFPSVRRIALPAFRYSLFLGRGRDDAVLEALVRLMVTAEDSNVLYRSGIEGMALMERQASAFMEAGGMFQDNPGVKLEEMNRLFVNNNISPGGCADLLALTLFLDSVEYNGNG